MAQIINNIVHYEVGLSKTVHYSLDFPKKTHSLLFPFISLLCLLLGLSSESQPFETPISNEIFIPINPNNLSLRSFTRRVSKLPQSQSDGYNCCSITSTSSEDRCCRMQYNRTLLEPKWDLLILKWLFCICSGLLDQCSSGV
jgi:hypothetical protein